MFVADYVLMGYGTGAIMAVPGQDERDWEFAERFGLPIVRTVAPPEGWEGEAYTGEGPAINSANDEISLDGLGVAEAKAAIIDWLEAKGLGARHRHLQAARLAVQPAALLGRAVPDRLRRGTACRSRCPTSMLPVELPEVRRLLAADVRRGRRHHRAGAAAGAQGRLGRRDAGPGRRAEGATAARPTRCRSGPAPAGTSCATWTRPTTSASSTPRSSATGWGPQAAARADTGGVDLYVGGAEHAVLHLLYARFWHKVLFDLGHVSSRASRSTSCSTRA